MARTTIVKSTLLGPYPALPVGAAALDLTWTASGAGASPNNDQVAITGDTILLAWNSGGSPYTLAILSVADDQGRSGDIPNNGAVYTLAAGDIIAFRLNIKGFRDSSTGMCFMTASNAAIKYAAFALS